MGEQTEPNSPGSDSTNGEMKEQFSFKEKMDGKRKHHYLRWLLEIFLCELVGTFFLVLFGCLSPYLYSEKEMKSNGNSSLEFEQTAVLRYSLSWGFAVSSVITTIGHISKAHLNPAVTLCALLLGHISLSTALVYWMSEILGSILGICGVWLSIPRLWYEHYDAHARCGLCCNCLHPAFTLPQGFILEFFATSLLVFVVCSVWDWRNLKWNDSTAIKFALVIAMLSMCLGPITGASMNPARSFGPALFNWRWTDHWMYWVSPMSASAVTTLFYRYVHQLKIAKIKELHRDIF